MGDELKELSVERAVFRAAGGPATVQIPSDKKIAASVTIENTGSETVSGDFSVVIYYGVNLPEEHTAWLLNCDAYVSDSASLTLNPGDEHTFTGFATIEASLWSEGSKVDAGVKVWMGDTLLDTLYIPDAIEIIAPALRVEITDVAFSATE